MPEDLMIPEQHAAETGNYIQPRGPGDGTIVTLIEGAQLEPAATPGDAPKVIGGTPTQLTGAPHFSAAHNAAAILHGWGKKGENWGHRHHAGEPIKLTRADYVKALEAASTTDEHGEYVPHPGALSKHAEAHAHHKAHAERVARIKAERERAEAEAKRRAELDAAEKKAAEEGAKAHAGGGDAGKGRGALDRGSRLPSVSPPAAPATTAAPSAPESTEASKV